MALTVRTNNIPRDVIDAYELSESERAEFDYIDWPAVERGEASASFFRYKGRLYDLGEFDRANEVGHVSIPGQWDGFLSDSFFSGIAVRYVDNYERVVVALVLS